MDFSMMASLMQLIQLSSDPSRLDQKVLNPQISDSSLLDCQTVQFYLATRELGNETVKACLEQNTTLFDGILDASKPTVCLAHGWMNSKRTEFTTYITESYLFSSDVNVIQVDWSAIAKKDYITARVQVPAVGKTVAAFIERINQELKVDLGDLHLIGHSLGAHVIGVAGYQFQSPNQIKTLTGLDPAGVLFWTTGSDGMITKESGEFVVILHTCDGILGTTKELGHADFYANGGTPIQPGCGFDLLGFCSHDRAIYVYSAAVRDPTEFDATSCSNYQLYLNGFCTSNVRMYFGDNVNRNASGKYYFKTSSSFPSSYGVRLG